METERYIALLRRWPDRAPGKCVIGKASCPLPKSQEKSALSDAGIAPTFKCRLGSLRGNNRALQQTVRTLELSRFFNLRLSLFLQVTLGILFNLFMSHVSHLEKKKKIFCF